MVYKREVRGVSAVTLAAVLTAAACSSGSTTGSTSATDGSSTADTSGMVDTSTVPLPGTAVTTPTGPGEGRCADHDDDPAAPVRVVVWEILGGEEAPGVFDDLVEEFRSEHPGIDLVVESVGGANQLLVELQQTPPELWPDAVVASPQALRRLVDTGRVVPPGECRGGSRLKEGLLPVVDGLYRYEGVTMGVPYGVSTPVLFFDAVEFRAAGLDPDDPPITLDELAAASARIVESGVSPHGLVVTDWYAHYLLLSGAVQRGEEVLEPGNGRAGGRLSPRFDTPGHRDTMSWLLDAVSTKGALWIGVTPSGMEDLTRIADPVDGGTMAIHTSGSIGDVLAILEAGSFPGTELGVGPMPGPARGATVGGNGWFLIDHGDPRRVGAAFQLVEWLSASERMARFVVATGYVPPRVAVTAEPLLAAAWEKYPQLRVGFDQILAQASSPAALGPLFGPNTEIDSVLFDFTTALIESGDSVAEALADLEIEVGALLAQYDMVVADTAGGG